MCGRTNYSMALTGALGWRVNAMAIHLGGCGPRCCVAIASAGWWRPTWRLTVARKPLGST